MELEEQVQAFWYSGDASGDKPVMVSSAFSWTAASGPHSLEFCCMSRNVHVRQLQPSAMAAAATPAPDASSAAAEADLLNQTEADSAHWLAWEQPLEPAEEELAPWSLAAAVEHSSSVQQAALTGAAPAGTAGSGSAKAAAHTTTVLTSCGLVTPSSSCCYYTGDAWGSAEGWEPDEAVMPATAAAADSGATGVAGDTVAAPSLAVGGSGTLRQDACTAKPTQRSSRSERGRRAGKLTTKQRRLQQLQQAADEVRQVKLQQQQALLKVEELRGTNHDLLSRLAETTDRWRRAVAHIAHLTRQLSDAEREIALLEQQLAGISM